MRPSINCQCGDFFVVEASAGELKAPMSAKDSSRLTISHSKSALPHAGLVATFFLGLLAACLLIAIVGWLLVRPSADSVTLRADTGNHADKETRKQGNAKLKTEKATEIAVSAVKLRVEEEMDEDLPADVPLLRRVVASQGSDDDQRFAPKHEPTDVPLAPRPSSSPHWVIDPLPASAMSALPPLAIAKFEDATVPYLLRRLELPGEAPKQLRLAVSPVAHDDLGGLLAKMGPGYQYTSLRREDPQSLAVLKNFDVVFLTCADLYAQDFQAMLPLRKFVADGGTLYASDLQADLVAAAFPEFRSRMPTVPGVPQAVEAIVTDKSLQAFLGRKAIPLSFEAPDWRPAPFDPQKVTVCLKGTFRTNTGHPVVAPLLVKFRFQKGTVIFTSFHHAKNDSEVVKKVLDYLVFASVNARSENRVKDLMQRSRFAPEDLRPAVLTENQSLESSYKHTSGGLQVALGFESLGAKVKLTLRSPSGRVIEHADQGVYLIEIPAAERGVWHCTVTPIELPFPNFPVVVAIGAGTAKK